MRIMKKQIALLTLIVMTLFTTQSSFGQESENTNSKFGLGVALFNIAEYEYDYDNAVSNSIYMTIDIGSKFRLEPTIGFALFDGFEQYSIGIGAFGKKSISQFNILYGLRLGLSSSETKVMAPTVGGEYYFIKNFSIGSEVQLRGLNNGGEWAVFTNSSVIIRFYF